jgi:hypothetical protein
MITKLKAIRSLDPNAHCTLADDVVVTWMTTPISEADIATEQTRLQAEYDSLAYARNRKAEYPSMADQLDDIFHNGIDGWKATIQVTKDKYPKG